MVMPTSDLLQGKLTAVLPASVTGKKEEQEEKEEKEEKEEEEMETKMSIVLSIICVLNPKDIIYIYIYCVYKKFRYQRKNTL